MRTLDFISVILFLSACFFFSYSDIKNGTIKNKHIVFFTMPGVILNMMYYFMAREDNGYFLLMVLIGITASTLLFYSGIWAGGDTKLSLLLIFLFPLFSRKPIYGFQLSAAIPFLLSFIFGFIYLLVLYFVSVFKSRINPPGIRELRLFLKYTANYLITALYVNSLFFLLKFLLPQFYLRQYLITIALFLFVWFFIKMEKKKILPLTIFILAANIYGTASGIINISRFNIRRYSVIFTIALMRILLKELNYVTIKTSEVKKGTILSYSSSMLLRGSRVKGLPGISTEDLKSRITLEEAESIKRWALTPRGTQTIVTVRKIPFAPCISLGFICYYIMGELLL